MAVANTQKLSFLGGLVSPSLYLRSDLEKFGKWFSKADNIRFNTIGSLENRFGTVHIASTKNNIAGETIKLISFVFNSNESCLLELGVNYCIVYRYDNGKTIYKTEFYTEINPQTDGDIKYAQSGDTIFLTTNKGVYEIIRLSKDFTSWEYRKFNWKDNILPLDEENDDNSKTISITTTNTTQQFSFILSQNEDGDTGCFYNPKITFTVGGQDIIAYEYTSGRIEYNDFLTALNLLIASYNLEASIIGNKLVFDIDTSTTVEKINIDYSIYNSIERDFINFSSLGGDTDVLVYNYEKLYGLSKDGTIYLSDITPSTNIQNILDNLNAILGYSPDSQDYEVGQLKLYIVDSTNTYNVIGIQQYALIATGNYGLPDRYGWTKNVSGVIKAKIYTLQSITQTNYAEYLQYIYTAQTSFNFFYNETNNPTGLKEDEIFSIRNTIEASNIHATYDGQVKYKKNDGIATTTPPTFLSDGNWRYNSSGLWNGTVNLYYSKDGGTSWVKFFTRTNDNQSQYSTTNDNTSGTIETGDLILLKMEATISSQNNDAKFNAELACKQFDVNSYYKIYTVTDEDTATVYCIKNDVGELTNMDSWRESAFSLSKGYPTAIGFYQNRLFLGKGYTIYSSATDDFWDFYEPVTVKDSDPITMSLLGYQVDSIQNIVTMRSFFVFTTGGEYGIGSEGALTQADKYLKQLSAHGSSNCNPIFCGDIVVFVDGSGNTVRAFQYSLDVDGYEATDVSVLIEQVLKGKTIKTTEYLKHSKECLFLTTDGDIYVFKFYQEQNIAAWSVWKHAKYRITNLCVVPTSNNKELLYIACDTDNGKAIEQFDESVYCDSLHTYVPSITPSVATDTFNTDFKKGDIVVVNDGIDSNYLVTVSDSGVITTRNDTTSVTVGLRYKSTATLLSPEIQQQDSTFTTFNKKRPFRVHLFYRDSYGFKVGVEDYDTEEIQYQDINAFIDQENNLVSGKAAVLVPARFDGNSRVTFVQELPYPMHIENVLIETDYGGK